jgi:hypothetical protein
MGAPAAVRPPSSPSYLLDSSVGTVASARSRPGGETAGMRTRRPRPAPATRSAFAGFRFPPDVIVLAVRWYLRFGLSYRDVEELLAERGIEVDHVTIYRWVPRSAAAVLDVLHTVLAPVTQRHIANVGQQSYEPVRPVLAGAAIHRADPPAWALPT